MHVETVFTVDALDVLANCRGAAHQIAKTLPADLKQSRSLVGEDGSCAGSAGQRGQFAEDFARADLCRASLVEDSRKVLQEHTGDAIFFTCARSVGRELSAI